MKNLPVFALFLCLSLSLFAQASGPPAPCSSHEHRQFDFWEGKWKVYNGNQEVGTNHVRRMLGGCMLMENWEGAGGSVGHSFNMYDASTQQWRQTWVDNGGTWIEFVGNWNAETGQMQLKGEGISRKDGKPVQYTLEFTPSADGAIRQLWQASRDGGQTWTVMFDGNYVKVGE